MKKNLILAIIALSGTTFMAQAQTMENDTVKAKTDTTGVKQQVSKEVARFPDSPYFRLYLLCRIGSFYWVRLSGGTKMSLTANRIQTSCTIFAKNKTP